MRFLILVGLAALAVQYLRRPQPMARPVLAGPKPAQGPLTRWPGMGGRSGL